MSRTSFRVNRHYNCLNIKELLGQNRRDIWSLSDSNRTRTDNCLVRKRTLSHLAILAKWLSCVWLWVPIPLLSLWYHYCSLWTCITPFSTVSIVGVEQVSVCWDKALNIHIMKKSYKQEISACSGEWTSYEKVSLWRLL